MREGSGLYEMLKPHYEWSGWEQSLVQEISSSCRRRIKGFLRGRATSSCSSRFSFSRAFREKADLYSEVKEFISISLCGATDGVRV